MRFLRLLTKNFSVRKVETSRTSGFAFFPETAGSDPRPRLLPVIVARLMLSLKKAANPREDGWSLGEPTTHVTMRFAERQGGVSTRDEVPLDTFASMQEGTRGQA